MLAFVGNSSKRKRLIVELLMRLWNVRVVIFLFEIYSRFKLWFYSMKSSRFLRKWQENESCSKSNDNRETFQTLRQTELETVKWNDFDLRSTWISRKPNKTLINRKSSKNCLLFSRRRLSSKIVKRSFAKRKKLSFNFYAFVGSNISEKKKTFSTKKFRFIINKVRESQFH